ncbi:hypothetical protein DFH07DRAFT_1060173 [Mycena maculata]|uniref:MYND-type domain-containing protein n=1 Tax=Mycena maculata TaxID=230809 RepID=A0AAD7JD20_9AGAR|nr:hypothetical protein DFH07DRAFT_1060173 [Mycena maculata]
MTSQSAATSSVPGPNSDATHFNEQAKEPFKNGDYTEAVRLYKLAIVADTSNSALYLCNLSAAYLKLRRFKGAESAAHTALIREPKSIKARYRRSVAKREQGRSLEALVDLSSVLAVSPGNAEALGAFQEISDRLLAGGTRRLCFHEIVASDYPAAFAPPIPVRMSLSTPIEIPPSIEALEDPDSGFIPLSHRRICQTCKAIKRRQKMKQCRNAMYCNKTCQRAHWDEHKIKCAPSSDNHRTLYLARRLMECEYFADLLTVYCLRTAGCAEGTFPTRRSARVLSVIVDMAPISTSPSSQGKRLRVKHLTAVPVAVLPEELVLSYNTMFTDMRGTYPDMPLICICITASGVHGRGEDPRFKMHMNVVAPELAPPDLNVLVRSASYRSDRLVTPDPDLLYSLIEEELAGDDKNHYGMRDIQ